MASKRKSALALALCLSLALAFPLSACADKNTSGGDTTEGTEAAGTTEPAVDPRLLVEDNLPAADYEGYVFRIYTMDDETAALYGPEDQVGEVINDAIYNRNKTVEERFNVVIDTISLAQDYNAFGATLKKSILAGDDVCDLALHHVIGGANYSLENLFVDFRSVPHLDFEKPWWPAQTVEELTLMGQMYVASNSAFLDGLSSTKVVYVNKTKLMDYGLEVPYNLVFEGKWTLDKLIELTKDVYEDLNGNGTRDEEDFYGYTSHALQNGFLVSCNVPVLTKEADNLIIDINNPKTITLVDKLYDWYTSQGCEILWTDKSAESGIKRDDFSYTLFGSGKSLFSFGHLRNAVEKFKSSEVEYGILPLPKFDESQEEYSSFASGNLMVIPATVSDLDREGVILEALSAEGYKQVYPAYYEIALKQKYLYDDESVQILDIITQNRRITFAYVYDNWEGFGHMFSTLFGSGSPSKDFTSFYDKRLPVAEKRYKKIVDAFTEMAAS